mmetsp:Transcript_22841/g.32699  ORF Transcript_22841/g.32699 Transcript_22841/m.32699 type:complete len:169 (+) Transcript_22841:61-567(+)|eukprot:CAMPEP_0202466150 /NCGR_PEP_ID=MMETSP1360-20130828/67750_1 /ASSEMBLY_ACC=CAM_ASM_000848 /TAXON_ID=515479 /ORGANISM="Licmophora paradoxa, Strain CCMP2313" /LENGTH=168 /DNA_ID=CAMNT_0049090179 /DNA_START=35 /DNA_END=541 /DNA_ORIENTATION=+
MNQVEAKYLELLQGSTWTVMSQRQQILALQAKLSEKLKKAKKVKKNPQNSDSNDTRIEWMTVPPKAGESNILQRDGKTWNWCKHHKKWVIHNGKYGKHTSATCRLNPSNRKKEGDKKKDKKRKGTKEDKKKKKVRIDAHAIGFDEDMDEASDSIVSSDSNDDNDCSDE